ncbi:MAG: flagellar export protein FliJ [Magnetococcales bacterium]|nr:flagellar export protein FliJ [Magnetococcales bacterium]
MNANHRFSRLVDIRRIREESRAASLAQAMTKLSELQQQLLSLQQETLAAQQEARQSLMAEGQRLSPSLYENYYKGQQWREQRLCRFIDTAQQTVERNRDLWLEARKLLQQVERLAEDAQLVREQTLRLQQLKEMDQVGITRYYQKDR